MYLRFREVGEGDIRDDREAHLLPFGGEADTRDDLVRMSRQGAQHVERLVFRFRLAQDLVVVPDDRVGRDQQLVIGQR